MKRLLILIFFIVLYCETEAQNFNQLFSISWDINQPLSNTDFIGNTSKQGFRIGYRQIINEHFLVGGDLSSSTFKGYAPRQTYYTSDGALTTDFFRYADAYGLTLSGDYLFRPEKKFQPFAGLGVGASYIDYKLYYNVYSASDPKWGVLLRPEAGAMVHLGRRSSWGILGALHYDFSSAKNPDFNYHNFSSIGFQIGVVFFNW